MIIRSPLDNRISRQDDSLLAQLARQEIDALTGLARLQAANERRTATEQQATERQTAEQPPATDYRPADRPETPELAEPAAAQEVTFAEVLQEMQTHIPPTYPADELPHWAKLNIQNAPPVVTKLLGMKAM